MFTENYSVDYFVEGEDLYFENIELKHTKKILNLESNIMNDDTFNAIQHLMSLNSSLLDLSGLLLEGTLRIDSKLNSIINLYNIKKIYCSNNYFDTIIIDLPNGIEEFEFEENPIKKIFFPYSFNRLIDNLIESVETIIFPFNSEFNKQIDNLPFGSKILCLGKKFNQSISNLPNSLIHLFLPNKYNIQIIKLPKNLKSLCFNPITSLADVDFKNNCLINLENCIPDNLEYLSLPIKYETNNVFKFTKKPNTIIFKSLEMNYSISKNMIKYLDEHNYSNIEYKIDVNRHFYLKQIIFYK